MPLQVLQQDLLWDFADLALTYAESISMQDHVGETETCTNNKPALSTLENTPMTFVVISTYGSHGHDSFCSRMIMASLSMNRSTVFNIRK